jgi:hypothetical protein
MPHQDGQRPRHRRGAPGFLQRQGEHAKEVRSHIVAAAGTLAAIAKEVVMLHQHRETRRPSDYYLG